MRRQQSIISVFHMSGAHKMQIRVITFNGNPYHVGANLWQSLDLASSKSALNNNLDMPMRIGEHEERQALDLRSSVSSMWIDAICIDQWSVWKHNHQVKLMGSIYHRSRQVLTWLGGDSVRSSHWFPTIREGKLVRSELAKGSHRPYGF